MYYVDPATGREVPRSTGTADHREAERAAAIWERELEESGALEGCRWEVFRDRFEREHLASLAVKSQKCYATALNAFERIAKVQNLKQVDASTISTFKAKLQEEGHKLTTVGSYLTHLRSALNWAASVDLLAKVPSIKMPKVGKRRMMRGRPLTEPEFQLMLKASPDEYKRFLELLWYSGMRLQEAMRLSWDEPPVTVQLDGRPYPHVLFLGEGQKSREDAACPIPPDFHAWLSKTPPEARKGRVAPLVSSRGSRDYHRVSEAITAIGKAAGVTVDDEGKAASAHDIRRAFGTRWSLVVRPLTLQKMMRHTSLSTTMRYYIGYGAADAGQELWGNSSQVTGPKSGPKEGSESARAG